MDDLQVKKRLRIVRYILYKETLVDKSEHFWTFLGGFFGIGIIGLINSLWFLPQDNLFLIGSFGASAVLLYGVINSPLAQPRNLIGGHVISAFIGVTTAQIVPEIMWLQAALAVPLAIVFMQLTKTLHPPGGATALIAIIGSSDIKELGYLYIVSPVLSGVLVLLAIALVFNNMTPDRNYPNNKNWYRVWERKYF